MKKCVIALFAALLLVGFCFGAQAEKLGTAVISAEGSGKVHLRLKETMMSESLGLFYSGTEVDILSDPDASWIRVSLDRLDGYIHRDYLAFGDAGDSVASRWQSGVVTAKNYVNMRKGPSTEYQVVHTVPGGQQVSVLGQTQSGWYYVLSGGKTGFVSDSLIELTGEIESAVQKSPVYKMLYEAYLLGQGDIGASYALIEVDGDGVPELVIDTGAEAGGCQILTCGVQGIDVLYTQRRGFTYIEGENLLSNSDGVQDTYYDRVYTIRDGQWTQVFSGDYFGYLDGWNDAQGRYVCKYYMVDGQETSMENYLKAYAAVYKEKRAVSAETGYDYAGIMAQLQ